MAANLDRAETSLTAVSDIAYIRGIDSSGNSVRISKADLASVLGVIHNKENNKVPSANINPMWISDIENSISAATESHSWFQGYSTASQEFGWIGVKTYQNRASIIAFFGYDNGSILKGYRDNDGNWSFYYLFGRT